MKKLCFFLLVCNLCLQAQVVRKYSNEFLQIGAGARGLGMGGAVVTTQDDVYAPMWNPAGLTEITDNWQGAAMHAEYFESITKYDYIGFATPVNNGQGALGISIIRLGIDNILNTTQLIAPDGTIDYDRISRFSQADYAAIFSYGFFLPDYPNLQLGANAKFIFRNVGKFANGYGFGFDLGAMYETPSGWRYGINLQDITTSVNFWTINEQELSTIVNGQEFNPTPINKLELSLPKMQAGVSKRWILHEHVSLLPEIGIQVTTGQTNAIISTSALGLSPYAGTELNYRGTVFLRAGVNRFQSVTDQRHTDKNQLSFQPSAGIGFKYKGVSLDYSLSNSGLQGSDFFSNFFSLKIDMAGFK